MTLGPHCQCSGSEEHWSVCPGHVEGQPRVRRVSVAGRLLSVPWWVSASLARSVRASAEEDLLSVRPRYHQRSRSVACAAGFPVAGRFRQHLRPGSSSRCQVPHAVYQVHSQMDDALRQSASFLASLHTELSAILGSVGTNEGMSSLLKACAVCWDWSTLVRERPRRHHVEAFLHVWRALNQLLQHTMWPGGEQFAGVTHAWPREQELAAQYMRLASRVREAAEAGMKARAEGLTAHSGGMAPHGGGMAPHGGIMAQHGGGMAPLEEHVAMAREWVKQKGVQVLPIWPCSAILGLTQQFARQHGLVQQRSCTARVKCFAVQLTRYLGNGLDLVPRPIEADKMLLVLGKDLRMTGAPRRRVRSKTREVDRATWLPGSVAALAHPGRHGLVLVEVVETQLEVDVAAVSAALDMCPWFSVGRGGGRRVCWHATRVHHRCRLMFPPESACERLGSRMSALWNPRQGLGPGPLCDRVLLAQAHVQCLGGPRDEFIVSETARLLQLLHKRRRLPIRRSSQVPRVLQQLRDAEEALQASGRQASAYDIDILPPLCHRAGRACVRAARSEYLHKSVPSQLPPDLGQVLHGAMGADGVLQALPAHQVELTCRRKGRGVSGTRERMTSWLESKEGAAWIAERERLYKADDP